jgi:hypothetical protein
MYRSLLTASVVLFLLAGSVRASIGRAQSFQIGGLNQVVWGGGVGSAQGENHGSFAQTQEVSDHSSRLSVRQAERGSLSQTATASGTGLGAARQTAASKGSQDLLAETTCGLPNRVQQELVVKLDMRLFRPNGVGTASGAQNFNGVQEQSVITPGGTSSQSQSVDTRQAGSITTQTNIDPSVKNTININLHQSQVTNGQ